jgi:hypothetical protein
MKKSKEQKAQNEELGQLKLRLEELKRVTFFWENHA